MSTLRRELDLYDLTLLLIVAVVNVNILPAIAAEGWRSILVWLLAFGFFFVPLAIAVADFGRRYPGEGGIYLWTRETLGKFHGFLSGWCYFFTNVFYVPSVLFILVGVIAYACGPVYVKLAESRITMAVLSLFVLWLITLLHIRGLGIGKWIHNIGAIGVWLSLLVLFGVGIIVMDRTGAPATPFHWGDLFGSVLHYRTLPIFAVAVYSLVGLELGSTMGDEIRSPLKSITPAVYLAAGLSMLLYLIGTVSLLCAVPAEQVGLMQGVMQAVILVAQEMQVKIIIPFVAIVISMALIGISSVWLGGSARIPFVMGTDSSLPTALGRIHPRWGTPYVALIGQSVVASLLILATLVVYDVRKSSEFLLNGSLIIQLIPILYLFLALIKREKRRLTAIIGFFATAIAILFFVVPALRSSGGVFAILVPPVIIGVIAAIIFKMRH